MKLDGKFWTIQALAFLALVIFAAAMGVLAMFDAYPAYGTGIALFKWFGVAFLGTILFGAAPVAIYGAPIYAYHLSRPTFSLWLVVAASALPGVIFWILVSQKDVARIAIFAGPIIALLLDQLARRKYGLKRKAA